ncbi:hypothetical protein LCGC14_1507700 [marine sediment metagenome]|uniref:Uncharacterized protein n=1 Tax=marine sediment metagenome TaxID=412755 RepID=A0A0F9J2P2_9ZZZZ
MPVAKNAYYPEKSPHFIVHDGDDFPTPVPAGARVVINPGRKSYIYTGQSWELEENVMDSVLEELRGLREDNTALAELARQLLNKL